MYLVDLDVISDNRFQPRSVIDYGTLADFALGILDLSESLTETKGLLQVPSGRLIDGERNPVDVARMADIEKGTDVTGWLREQGLSVELAFGSRRTKSFEWLALGGGDEEKDIREHFNTMPMRLANYTDEQMAVIGYRENGDREDLSDMDRARAIVLFRETFDFTQMEAADKLGLTRQTLSNLERLVNLPADWQEALHQGEISARQAMAALPALNMPQGALDKAAGKARNPGNLLASAKRGESSAQIREQATTIKELGTCDFADFNGADIVNPSGPVPLAMGVRFETCSAADGSPACDQRVKFGVLFRCGDPVCFEVKRIHAVTGLLNAASAGTGLPILPSEVDWNRDHLFYSGRGENDKDVAAIIEDGCDNLFVGYRHRHDAIGPSPWDHRGVFYVCRNGSANCTCVARRQQAKIRAARDLEKRHDEILKETTRDAEARVERRVIDGMAAFVAHGMLSKDDRVWSELHRLLQAPDDRENMPDVTAQDAALKIARMVVRNWRGMASGNVPKAREFVAREAARVGLEVPWGDLGGIAHPLFQDDAATPWGWCCPDCRTEHGLISELKRRDDWAICPEQDCGYEYHLDDLAGDWDRGPISPVARSLDRRHVVFLAPPPVQLKKGRFCPRCQPEGARLTNLHPDHDSNLLKCDNCNYAYNTWAAFQARKKNGAELVQADDGDEVVQADDGDGDEVKSLEYEQAVEAA